VWCGVVCVCRVWGLFEGECAHVRIWICKIEELVWWRKECVLVRKEKKYGGGGVCVCVCVRACVCACVCVSVSAKEMCTGAEGKKIPKQQ